MVEQNTFSPRHSPGIIWACVGWLGLATTLLLYLGVRSHLGKGDAGAVLILGGIPSLLGFGVALGRGYFVTAVGSGYNARERARRVVIGSALVGLLCMAGGVGTLGIEALLRSRQDARCVGEAQAVVASDLERHPPPGLGAFRGVTGEGYDNPPPWSPAGYYLRARRTAHFANGDSDIEIIITPTSGDEVMIERVEGGSRFIVSHPRFGE